MRLTILGTFLYKIWLLDYFEIVDQVVTEPHVTLRFWIDAIVQAFCKHQYERLYRIAKEGEFLHPDKLAGCVPAHESVCKRCHKIIRT